MWRVRVRLCYVTVNQLVDKEGKKENAPKVEEEEKEDIQARYMTGQTKQENKEGKKKKETKTKSLFSFFWTLKSSIEPTIYIV